MRRLHEGHLEFVDYRNKLSDDEKKFLDQFTSEFYGHAAKPVLMSQEQLKRAWGARNAYRRDIVKTGKPVSIDSVSALIPSS